MMAKIILQRWDQMQLEKGSKAAFIRERERKNNLSRNEPWEVTTMERGRTIGSWTAE